MSEHHLVTVGQGFLDDHYSVSCSCGYEIEGMLSQEAAAEMADHHRADLLDQKEQSTRDPIAEIDGPVVIWFCPHRQERGCKFVEWDDDGQTMTPRCRDCGEVGPSLPKRPKKEQSDD